MSLADYRKKRKFQRTPEPKGQVASGRGPLRFVVQKHQASRLHYDFRLELNGTLKSWAIPKGPSLNPDDKRLAMMVEDHPLDYRTFEGTIPEGNYGAGSVIVWDEGTYQAVGEEGRSRSENRLQEELKEGQLKFILEGKKLRGEFALVRMKRASENAWLLLKKRDEFASTDDVTILDQSVRSGRRLEDSGTRPVSPARTKPARKTEAPGAVSRSRKNAATGPTLTNLDKLYWPDEGITKGDLIAYYRDVAPVLLPHLRDRAMSLHRHPDGIHGKSFFQKDVRRQPPPDWVQTVTIPPKSGAAPIVYCLSQDLQSLLYLVNLGCIELNPWTSRVGSLERPDFLVIDLDPEAISFARVIEAAVTVRKVLEKAGGDCYCKTSGKRGLHVAVPLGAKYDFDEVRPFAELLATIVHQRLPESTSLERSPARRQKRVYLDYLQNRIGQTLVAPYSVRPVPNAPVSTPLHWREVRRGLDPTRFTMRTTLRRLDRTGDLWSPVMGKGMDLRKCHRQLESQQG